MAFEVYVPRATNENRVAITKHHIRIGNRLASYLKGDFVEVAYDKDEGKLRIRGTESSGMKISKNKIGAMGIFKYFNIENKRGSYSAEYVPAENAIYVDLNS